MLIISFIYGQADCVECEAARDMFPDAECIDMNQDYSMAEVIKFGIAEAAAESCYRGGILPILKTKDGNFLTMEYVRGLKAGEAEALGLEGGQ